MIQPRLPEAEHRPPELSHLLGHADWLRSLARVLVSDGAAADDLVQETWLAALRNPPDPDRPARPWLAGVMRNLVRLRARTDGRWQKRQERAARREETPPSTEIVEREEIGERLAELVLHLGEPYRRTVLLHYFHGLTAAEIARREGLSSGTVRWRLWRALDELRGRLRSSAEEGRNWLPAVVAFARAGSAPKAAPASLAPTLAGGAFAWKLAGLLALVLLSAGIALDRASRTDATEREQFARLEPERANAAHERAATHAPSIGPASRAALALPESAAPARLRIVEHDGRPAAGWPTAVASGGGALQLLVTDEEGCLPSSAIPPGAHLFLGRPNAPIELLSMRSDEPQREVQLARGHVLSGHVRVGGRAPETPLTLFITSDQPLHEALLSELGVDPSALYGLLGKGRRVRTETSADGSFAFHGLSEAWSGMLVAPLGHELVREASGASDGTGPAPHDHGYFIPSLHYAEPRAGLVLELERLPHVRGRVVEAASGRAIAGASLRWSPRHGAIIGKTVELFADADGRFDVSLPLERASAVLLEYRDAAGERGGALTLSREELAQDVELGDLAVGGPRSLAFAVRDAGGAPIAGALARVEDSPEPSAPTDADGRGAIELPQSAGLSLRVSAEGYVSRTLALPADPREPLAVVLERASALRVLVSDAQGAALADLALRVSSVQPLFVEGMELENVERWRPTQPGAQKFLGGIRTASPQVVVQPGLDGSVVLHGLRERKELRLELLDATGSVVLERELAGLEPGELREVELRFERALVALEGTVEIAGGEGPLVGAIVHVFDDVGGVARTRAGRDGSFCIRGFDAPRVRIEISKAGFEPIVIEEHVLARGAAPLHAVLGRAAAR